MRWLFDYSRPSRFLQNLRFQFFFFSPVVFGAEVQFKCAHNCICYVCYRWGKQWAILHYRIRSIQSHFFFRPLISGSFLANCNLCAGASIQPRYFMTGRTPKKYLTTSKFNETASIVLFSTISVTGANIYLIGGVVCIVCVFYTLVVSTPGSFHLGHNSEYFFFSGRHQSCGADRCMASDCYVHIGRCLYWFRYVSYWWIWKCLHSRFGRW